MATPLQGGAGAQVGPGELFDRSTSRAFGRTRPSSLISFPPSCLDPSARWFRRRGSIPWKGSTACVYDPASIIHCAPTTSGVYAFLSLGRWLYVGESGSPRGSRSLQLSGVNPCLTGRDPARLMYELVPDADRAARRRELILECQPACHM